MAPIGKLYAPGPEAAKAWRSVAAAKYAGVELEIVPTAPRNGDCQKAEYKAKFPMAKVPAFEAADGSFTLSESRAIARYVASFSKNTPLLGNDEKTAAQIDQWVQFADDEIFNHALAIFAPSMGFTTYVKPNEQKSWENLNRSLAVLDAHLKKNTFLVGHRISLADLVVVSSLRSAFTMVAGQNTRSRYPNVVRLFNTVHGQPTLKEIAATSGPLLEEDFKFTPPKKEAAPKEKAAPAAAAAPAVPKASKSKSKKEDDDEEDEPLVPAEPKQKNPLDDLPKSPFILDEWKRVYSNKDTRSEALPWFFENFDAAGWSVWRFDFKYNDELTQIFMSANQIGGFFNRLEASRKYVFGTAGVFGEANKSAIAGVVVVRGKEYEPVLNVAPDLESYSVTPLDITQPEQKKFFEDMLAWEATVEGKAWADGKILK